MPQLTAHQKKLQKAKERKAAHDLLEKELQTINMQANIRAENRDITSLRYKLAPMLEISNSDVVNNHYRELIKIYQQANYKFTMKNCWHFMFNPFALIFGVLYFSYMRLYAGLFLLMMVLLIIAPFMIDVLGILPIGILVFTHIICAMTADFFIIHKSIVDLDKSITQVKNNSEYDILRQCYVKSAKFKTLHLITGCIYSSLSLYCVMAFMNTDFNQGIFSGFSILEQNVMKDINVIMQMQKPK